MQRTPIPNQRSGDEPPRPRGRRLRGRSLTNAVIGAALLAEAIALAGHPVFGWGDKFYVATPPALVYTPPVPPTARDVLLALAGRAAAGAGPSASRTRATPYAYVLRQDWRLGATAPGSPDPSVVLPTVTESWLAPDGAGRIRRSTARPEGRPSVADVTVGRGRPLAALSVSPALLERRFPPADPSSPAYAGQFAQLTALASRQPIPAAAAVVILRRLARIPGLINSGSVTDRDRRPGVAVSLDSAVSGTLIRYTLIFAAGSGALLESDQQLIGEPPKPEIQPGAMLAYTTLLASGYVTGPHSRP